MNKTGFHKLIRVVETCLLLSLIFWMVRPSVLNIINKIEDRIKSVVEMSLTISPREEAEVPAKKVFGDFDGNDQVNLADFSILLFYWNSSNPTADANNDGKVNLADFSIMLFNWTG